jgi:hypothetical protein
MAPGHPAAFTAADGALAERIEYDDVKKEPGLLQAARDVILAIVHDPMMLAPVVITVAMGLAVAAGLAIWWK